jgi:uncharacterized protein YuzE
MKIRYFTDTDTLYIEFTTDPVAETRDIGADAIADFGADGAVCAITVEHASKRTGLPNISIEHVAN